MNYPEYDPGSAVTPLSAEELGALDRLLQGLAVDAVMTLDGVDGYLTALLVGPDLLARVPVADWLPLVWGGDPAAGPAEAAPFATRRQRKTTVVMLLRHLRHLSQQIHESPSSWEPIFSVAEQGEREWVDARDWCAGFLQAVDLLPSAWDAIWADPVRGPGLAPLLVLGGGVEGVDPVPGAGAPIDPDDLAGCDELSRAVPEGVLRLAAGSAPDHIEGTPAG